jgi:predicted transcriptional regulator
MKIRYQDIAELLGISELSAQIYVELMTHYLLSVAEIRKLTGLDPKKIKTELQHLIDRNLVKRMQKAHGVDVYKGISLLQMEEKLERDKIIFQNLKKIILPVLNQPQKLGILKYEGIEGVRKVYLEILEEARKNGEDILAIENGKDFEVLGEAFIHNYVQKRISSKVKAHIITPDSLEDREFKDEYEGKYTSIKLLRDFRIKANINIVSNLVMTFSLNPLQGTLRMDRDEAFTLKEIFKKMWGL